jgi:hypothetical protein
MPPPPAHEEQRSLSTVCAPSLSLLAVATTHSQQPVAISSQRRTSPPWAASHYIPLTSYQGHPTRLVTSHYSHPRQATAPQAPNLCPHARCDRSFIKIPAARVRRRWCISTRTAATTSYGRRRLTDAAPPTNPQFRVSQEEEKRESSARERALSFSLLLFY